MIIVYTDLHILLVLSLTYVCPVRIPQTCICVSSQNAPNLHMCVSQYLPNLHMCQSESPNMHVYVQSEPPNMHVYVQSEFP